MKKYVIIVFCTLISVATTWGQTREVRTPGAFTEVIANGTVNVRIEPGEKREVILESEENLEFEGIVTDIKGKALTVRIDRGNYKDKRYVVRVITPELNEVRARTGAEVKIPKPIGSNSIEVSVMAGGQVWLKVDHDLVDLSVKQGGSITVFGATDVLNASVLTGGTIASYQCSAQHVNATVRAGGDIFCRPVITLKGKASVGNVYYLGDPETVDVNTVLGSKLEKATSIPEFKEDF